ncbi:MAG: hypothetical protein ABIJ03_01190 [Patescibacteria group bacterium]|nr:hypothetical protein [Patescibacteria group bacterium]
MPQTSSHSFQLPVILQSSTHRDQFQVALAYIGPVPTTSLTWFNQSGEGIGIEQVRQITTGLGYAGLSSGLQRIILLNAHQITLPAQNALLKILEETPHHSQIILVTSHPNQLLPTITSRCQLINMTQAETQTLISPDSDWHYSELSKASASQIIKLSSGQKDRSAAMAMLNQLLEEIHQLPATNQTTHHAQLLLRGLSLLEENVNLRLVLEAVFFQIAGLSTASKKRSSVLNY